MTAQNKGTTTICQCDTRLVDEATCRTTEHNSDVTSRILNSRHVRGGTADPDIVGAARACAALVPRREQVEIVAVFEDDASLDCAAICGALCKRGHCVAGEFTRGGAQLHLLDASPEASEG